MGEELATAVVRGERVANVRYAATNARISGLIVVVVQNRLELTESSFHSFHGLSSWRCGSEAHGLGELGVVRVKVAKFEVRNEALMILRLSGSSG